MNFKRKTVITAVLTLLTVGLFSAPGTAAPEKIFSLQAPATLSPGTQDIQLTIKNETPTGNSSINSLKIQILGTGLTINSVTAPSGHIAFTSSSIEIQNVSPIKNKQSYTISANVTATVVSGCGAGITWDTQSWTGSSFSGNTFRLLRTEVNPVTHQPYSNLATSISAGCGLRFNPAPVSSTTGSNIPVTVQVVAGSPAAVVTGFTGTLSLAQTAGPSGLSVSPASVPISNGTASADFTLNGTNSGNYEVTASSTGFTSITAQFQLFAGILDCGDTTISNDDVNVYRGPNKDGSACVLVPYTLTSDFTQSTSTVTFVWDENSQPTAQYKATVPWPASTDDNPDYASNVTTYEIGNDGAKPLTFCDGMTAVQDNGGLGTVSSTLGTLNSGVTAADGALSVNTSGAPDAPTAPFDAFVDNEWVRVTSVSGATWSVQRGYGGTTAANHSTGADVLLALPIFPTGEKACLSNTSTVGVAGTTQTQTTEEIWFKGDLTFSKSRG